MALRAPQLVEEPTKDTVKSSGAFERDLDVLPLNDNGDPDCRLAADYL
jgi:hypothetical protein